MTEVHKSILDHIFGPIVPTCRWCGTPVDEGVEYCSEDCRKGAKHFRADRLIAILRGEVPCQRNGRYSEPPVWRDCLPDLDNTEPIVRKYNPVPSILICLLVAWVIAGILALSLTVYHGGHWLKFW